MIFSKDLFFATAVKSILKKKCIINFFYPAPIIFYDCYSRLFLILLTYNKNRFDFMGQGLYRISRRVNQCTKLLERSNNLVHKLN